MQPTILVIDDEHDNRDLVTWNLARAGYRVRQAGSGRAALQEIAENAIDAVLLDIRLPDLDGLDLCRQLRANPDTQHLPIMIVSAYADCDSLAAGYAAGADDYLTKPYLRGELLPRVLRLLRTAAPAPVGAVSAAMRSVNRLP